MESLSDERLFSVINEAIKLGLLPREVTGSQYIVSVERIRMLTMFVDASRPPGPDVRRLLDVSARMLDAYDVYAIEGLFEEFRSAVQDAIAEHEAGRG